MKSSTTITESTEMIESSGSLALNSSIMHGPGKVYKSSVSSSVQYVDLFEMIYPVTGLIGKPTGGMVKS